MVRHARWITLAALAFVIQGACSNEGSPGDSDGLTPPGSGGIGSGSGGSSGGPGDPELELEENFRAPVVSGSYLWTANPETNRVALLHARTLAIQVLEGGNAPTFLASLPGGDQGGGALVINVAGGDASVFRHDTGASLGGASGASVVEDRVRVQAGASAWAVGESGRFAVAWSRFQDDLKGPLDGYQDLTVIDASGQEPMGTRLSVGFRPSKVVLNQSETRAYVVCKPGISVIDLEAEPPRVAREFSLPEDDTGLARDVSFSPDGSLALVRVTGEAEVRILNTEDASESVVVLPREVTDLDLSQDGTLAVAVMRGTPGGAGPSAMGGEGGLGGEGGEGGAGTIGEDSLIALLPVPAIKDAPEDFEVISMSELVGSAVVSEDARVALLYTNAIASPRLTILDLGSLESRVVDVTAPVQAAFLTPDGAHAVAVMTPPSGSQAAGAFALVPVEKQLPARIEGTDTVPRFVALSNESALLTTWGSETLAAKTRLGHFPGLSVDTITLSAEPLASGLILDERRGFVAEAHPQGQVTFVDLDSGESRTVTGFELSSQVVDP